MSRFLVEGPAATEFLDLAHTDTGLRAMLGDPKTEAGVGPDIVRAHISLREGVKKLAALARDPTRTEVDRHMAAKKVAGTVVADLTKTKSVIERRAEELRTETLRKVDLEFGPTVDRAALQSEVRGWIREAARTPEGLEKIRAAMKDSDDVAAVLWHSPSFLTGLPAAIHETLRLDALELRRPNLYADLEASVELDAMLAKYDKAVRKVESSFYSPVVASQGAKRVEV